MDDAEAVGAANDAFYLAFEKRDLLRMRACWRGHPDDVCIHPGWEVMRGKKVMESWRDIFATGMPMRFVISDVSIEVVGNVARVHNVENIYLGGDGDPLGRVAVTHLFQRVGADWLLVLHHGSPIAQNEPPEPDDNDEYH